MAIIFVAEDRHPENTVNIKITWSEDPGCVLPVDGATAMEMLLQLLSSGPVVNIADVDTLAINVHFLLQRHVELARTSGHG